MRTHESFIYEVTTSKIGRSDSQDRAGMVVTKSLRAWYMYRKLEFLYMLHGICIEISDIVFGRNQPTAGQDALIQASACSASSKVR